MSLSTMFALPFLSFVFPRFIRSLIPPKFYRMNSKIYAAHFLLPLSYRCQITHVTRDVLLYMCVFLCFSFTCVRFVPSTLRNYQIYRLSNLCTSIDPRTYTRRHSCPILCQSLPHSYQIN